MSQDKKKVAAQTATGAIDTDGGPVVCTNNNIKPANSQYPFNISAESCYHLAEIATDEEQRARWLARGKEQEQNDSAHLDKFLAHLHRGGAYAYLWRPHISRWYETGRKRPKVADGQDCYFGVHPSRFIPETNAKGERQPPQKVRSQIESISAINCVFAEFDAKDFIANTDEEIAGRAALAQAEYPDWPADKVRAEAVKSLTDGKLKHYLDLYKDLARTHIETLHPAPTWVIDSGRGYHCYWALVDPFYTVTHETRERAQRLQAAWVNLVGGDTGAKDLARVLRLPGTRNMKHGEPGLPVTFVTYAPERTYTLDDLEAAAARAPKRPEKPMAARAPKTPHKPQPITADLVTRAQHALDRLASWRVNEYESWRNIGFALSELGDAGFRLWDNWSQQSPKYHDEGNARLMAYKWSTFTPAAGITLGSLFHWAKEDSGDPVGPVLAAPKAAKREAAELPERLQICGVRVEYPDPDAPDQKKHKVLVCGDYRNCEFCATTKARDLLARIGRAVDAGPVCVVRMTVKEGRALIRRHGKDACLRVPCPICKDKDEEVIIFNPDTGTEILPGGLPALESMVDLVRAVPDNKRITGALGKEDEGETLEPGERAGQAGGTEGEPILVKMIAHDADKETADKIYRAAWERTKKRVLSIDFKTALDVENALDIIQTEYKTLLRTAGFEIEHQVTREVTCHLARISIWRDTYALNDIGGDFEPARELRSTSRAPRT